MIHPKADIVDPRVRTRIIAGVILGAFLAALDTTILATVMPTIVGELGGLHLYSWIFSVYMIMTAVSMPIWGRLSDAVGRKTLFSVAVGVFLLGSVLCGLSVNMLQLIVFRGIQGIGAGGLASIPFALVSTVFPPRDRGKALGILASAWGVSSVIGPLLGSAIVTYAHWRGVFYINIPLGAAAVAIIARNYSDSSARSQEPIDYGGAGLLAIAIVALLLAVLGFGGRSAEIGGDVTAFSLVSLLFGVLFVWRETRAPHPLLELALFRKRAFSVGNVLGFVSSFAMYGIIAFVPLFAQSVQGGTAMKAGLVITPMSLAWSGASFTAGRLTGRLGENTLIRAGMVFMAAGFILTLFTTHDTSIGYLMLCVATVGTGMGCQTPSLMLTVQHSVEHRYLGVATSTQMLARTIGGAVGVSVMGSAVTGSMIRDFEALDREGGLAGFPAMVRALIVDPQKLLAGEVRALLSPGQLVTVLSVFTQALHAVFIIGLVTIIAGMLLSLLLPPSSMHLPTSDN
jgi:EmrB/QacA subfamily drug resistance transporter